MDRWEAFRLRLSAFLIVTTRILTVAGGSGSGKSTLARELRLRLTACGEQAVVLPLDAYYLDLRRLSFAEREEHNFDHPDALDWKLLHQHLEALGRNEPATRPHYDFASHTRSADEEEIAPGGVVILEGLFALWSERALAVQTLGIWIEAPEALRFQRRLGRDAAERGRSEGSVRRQWSESVEPMFREHVAPTRARASLVVDGEGSLAAAVESAWLAWEQRRRGSKL